jgi:GMP synthase (glutamine-hydrolysing)
MAAAAAIAASATATLPVRRPVMDAILHGRVLPGRRRCARARPPRASLRCMQVLVVLHSRQGDAGLLGAAAREAGHELTTWVLPEEPEPDVEADAVIVMGGTPHPDQERLYPWLLSERARLRAWLEEETPLLTVCLGAQQLARTLGGETAKLEPAEIGWYPIRLTAQAKGDPLLGGEHADLVAYQSHRHHFTLPPGAVPLVESELCLQAFRYGESAWAFQFHPEVTAEILERWFVLYLDDVDAHRIGFDEGAVRDACGQLLPPWTALGRRIAERFLAHAEELAQATRAA